MFHEHVVLGPPPEHVDDPKLRMQTDAEFWNIALNIVVSESDLGKRIHGEFSHKASVFLATNNSPSFGKAK